MREGATGVRPVLSVNCELLRSSETDRNERGRERIESQANRRRRAFRLRQDFWGVLDSPQSVSEEALGDASCQRLQEGR